MKKMLLFIFASCVVSLSAMDNRKIAANKEKMRCGQTVGYPYEDLYRRPYQALIYSIEEGRNDVAFFVENFGFKILSKRDTMRMTASKSMFEVAVNAGNQPAVDSIKALLVHHQSVVIRNHK